jgi:hypothetical protein
VERGEDPSAARKRLTVVKAQTVEESDVPLHGRAYNAQVQVHRKNPSKGKPMGILKLGYDPRSAATVEARLGRSSVTFTLDSTVSRPRRKDAAPLGDAPAGGMADYGAGGGEKRGGGGGGGGGSSSRTSSRSSQVLGAGTFFALDEAWPALRFLTLAFSTVAIGHAAYMEFRDAEAKSYGTQFAGLVDSAVVQSVPVAQFWGDMGVKTWVVALSCVAAVCIATSFMSAVAAHDLRARGMLPHTFDMLIPRVANCRLPKRKLGEKISFSCSFRYEMQYSRVAWPIFSMWIAWATSVGFSIALFLATDGVATGNYVLLLAGAFAPPLMATLLYLTRIFIANDLQINGPPSERPPLTRLALLKCNALAGLPLARMGRLEAWRRQLTFGEKELVKVLEFGPEGKDPSLFARPAIRGEPDPELFVEEARRAREAEERASGALAAKLASLSSEGGSKEGLGELALQKLKEIAEQKGIDLATGRPKNYKARRTMLYWACCCCCFECCPRIDLLALFGPCTRMHAKWKLGFVDPSEMGFFQAILANRLNPTDWTTLRFAAGLLLAFMALGLGTANPWFPLVNDP